MSIVSLKDPAVKAKYKDFFRGSLPAGELQSEMNEDEDEDLEAGDGEMEDDEQDDDDEPREKRVK